MSAGSDPLRPPSRLFALGRFLLRGVVRAPHRTSVEGDLIELWRAREQAGRRDLRRAYVRDLAGLVWRRRVDLERRQPRRRRPSLAESARSVGRDVAFAVRMMRRQPFATAAGLLTLALGIAASAATVTAVDRLLLRPLPLPEPERLLHVENAPISWSGEAMLPASFRRLDVFEAAGVYAVGGANLDDGATSMRVAAAAADDGFFASMAVPPLIGRAMPAGSGRTEPRFAMIGCELWRRRFGGDRGLPGREIRLNRLTYIVAGVMPPGFSFPGRTEVWVQPNADFQLTGAVFAPDVVARLAPGVELSRARAALDVYNAAAQARAPAGVTREPTTIEPLTAQVSSRVRPTLLLLAVSVSLLLLVVCTNVANLLLARVAARAHEFAVRRALGGSRWRLARQLIVESVLLAAIAGLAGIWAAGLFLRGLGVLAPAVLGDLGLGAIDWRLVLAALAVSGLAGVIFGLGPGLAAAAHSAHRVIRSGRGSRESNLGRRVRGGLIVVQMAAVLVLLTAGTATFGTLVRLARVDLGFSGAQALGFQVTLPLAGYTDVVSWIAFYERARERLLAAPGVVRVAATGLLPGSSEIGVGLRVSVPGRTEPAGARPFVVSYLSASPDYFAIMGVPIVAGRPFLPSDRRGAPEVAILSESAARSLFRDAASALGQRVIVGRPAPGTTPKPIEIVGVAADVLLRGPDASSQMQQQMYVSLLQNPPFGSLAFVAGTEGDPLRAAAGLSAAMHDVDPSVPVYNVEALSSVSNRFLAPSRLALALIGGFAVVTLVVAAVGLYGLMAQAVAARAREIGIRMALGAEPGRLRRRIVAEGAAVALAGAALGASAAVVSHGAFAAVLPDMTAIDWRTLAVHAAVLLGAAVVATWAPASRAARVDPTVTLRD